MANLTDKIYIQNNNKYFSLKDGVIETNLGPYTITDFLVENSKDWSEEFGGPIEQDVIDAAVSFVNSDEFKSKKKYYNSKYFTYRTR